MDIEHNLSHRIRKHKLMWVATLGPIKLKTYICDIDPKEMCSNREIPKTRLIANSRQFEITYKNSKTM